MSSELEYTSTHFCEKKKSSAADLSEKCWISSMLLLHGFVIVCLADVARWNRS